MPKKIRVVMAGRYPIQEGKPVGGPESVAEVLADALSDSGEVDIHFITNTFDTNAIQHRRTKAGVNVHIIPEAKFGTWTHYCIDRIRINKLVSEINPDIVHVHGTMGPFAHSLVGRQWPSVLAIRGIFFKEIPFMQAGITSMKEKYRSTYEISTLKRAQNIICLNKYTSSSVSDWIGKANVRYIDNPVDDSFFDLQNNEEENRLLLLAVVRRLKGHEFAIKALSKLIAEGRNVKLYCVGAVQEPDYYEEIKQLITDLNLEEHVHIEGNASRSSVLEHYSRCSVVVLPSLVENAPVVVSEAMAAGKAVIATPAGGITEMIDNGKDGTIVPMADENSLAAAIGNVLDSANLKNRLATQAKLAAEKRFRREVSVKKTIAFYRDILGWSD